MCCSVLFSLLSLGRFSDYEIRARDNESERSVSQPISSAKKVHPHPVENSSYLRTLHFANEFLPIEDKRIQKKLLMHLQRFSYKNQKSHRIHDLAISSLPKVEAILNQYGIPNDFKYIPLVESRFEKNVASSKGASGYWQFMPATARAFGLKVNDEIDERQHLIKSTHAAARYLQALHREFGNWALVAAAYNMGSGNLRKAIRAQGEDNYFHLELNRETGAYVYQLIAIKEIIENPARHGYSRDGATLLTQATSAPARGVEADWSASVRSRTISQSQSSSSSQATSIARL